VTLVAMELTHHCPSVCQANLDQGFRLLHQRAAKLQTCSDYTNIWAYEYKVHVDAGFTFLVLIKTHSFLNLLSSKSDGAVDSPPLIILSFHWMVRKGR
jgi:hypothetical protein